jgi:hypothetical protein
MQRTTHHKHSHKRHSAAGDMLTHASLEGLLASIPAMVMMSVKETLGASLQSTVRGAIAKGEKVAGEAVNEAAGSIKAGKFTISKPVIAAAVVLVGAAVVHGAWRGKRKHEERSFAEVEEERRAQRSNDPYARASA